jgi:hypothetical protein
MLDQFKCFVIGMFCYIDTLSKKCFPNGVMVFFPVVDHIYTHYFFKGYLEITIRFSRADAMRFCRIKQDEIQWPHGDRPALLGKAKEVCFLLLILGLLFTTSIIERKKSWS